MKKLLVLLTFFVTGLSWSQFTENTGHIWLKYGIGKMDTANFQSFSASGEYLFPSRLGLVYNLDVLVRNDDVFQIHSSVGALAGPPLILFGLISSLSDGDTDDDFDFGTLGTLLGIAILIAPDGVSYHFPIGYKWDIAPYANVLGIDYVRYQKLQKGYFKYAASFGTKATFWQESGFTMNAFMETRKVAGNNWTIGGGFGIGYAF